MYRKIWTKSNNCKLNDCRTPKCIRKFKIKLNKIYMVLIGHDSVFALYAYVELTTPPSHIFLVHNTFFAISFAIYTLFWSASGECSQHFIGLIWYIYASKFAWQNICGCSVTVSKMTSYFVSLSLNGRLKVRE